MYLVKQQILMMQNTCLWVLNSNEIEHEVKGVITVHV